MADISSLVGKKKPKQPPAVSRGTEYGANAKVMAVKRKLTEMGAPKALIDRAQPHWYGNEDQVRKTHNKLNPDDKF